MSTLTAEHKLYPIYKPSGVEWLGEVPVHWKVWRLRISVSHYVGGVWGSEPNGVDDLPCVRVADFDRKRLRVHMDSPTLRSITQNDRYKRVLSPGDLLVEKSGGGDLQPVGVVMLYDHLVPAVCSNFIARVQLAPDNDPVFFTYLHSTLYAIRLNSRAIKQTTGIQNLDISAYLGEFVCFPPLAEQRAIAAFLDRETAKIDALISKKERLIELLQEKRTALISHTVTRGLNPDAPMKDSGIEWLGEIPANWEVKRLKDSVTDYVGGVWGSDPNGLDDLPCVRVADFDRIRLRVFMNSPTMRAIAPNDRRQRVLSPGDLLLEKSGGGDLQPVGAVMLYDYDTPAVCSNFIARLRIAVEYNPVFLTYFHFALYAIRLNTKSIKQTTGIQNLDTSAYLNELVSFPPLAEQNAIVAFLDRETTKLDSLIASVREAIRLLRELRTALISAAVTGKIDVREEMECT